MAVRRKQIREIVEHLLAEHHVTQGAVPVEKIVKSYGIEIKLDKVDDELSGFLVREKRGQRRSLIGANKSHHPHRQRFTIAHELGHYLLHQGEPVHLDDYRQAFTINLRDEQSAKGEDSDEREANLFAAELLMPAKFLMNDLSGKNLDLLGDSDFLDRLAKKYKVSTQALTFRLANLGYIRL
jgi:Zn-dependent peptidase ImmA (M78 family)